MTTWILVADEFRARLFEPLITTKVNGIGLGLPLVRRVVERQANGISLAQLARELDIRPDLLRTWVRQAQAHVGAAPRDVFPGQGRLPSDQEELRRLQRENARLQQEVEFLKRAAAYFARESR